MVLFFVCWCQLPQPMNKRMLGELGKTWMSFRDLRDVLIRVNLYKILGVKTTFFVFSAIKLGLKVLQSSFCCLAWRLGWGGLTFMLLVRE